MADDQNAEQHDSELDELLASALEDFDQPAKDCASKPSRHDPSLNIESSVDPPHTANPGHADSHDPIESLLSDEMAKKATEELDHAMKMLVGDNPEMAKQLEQFAHSMEETMLKLQQSEEQSEGDECLDTKSDGREDGQSVSGGMTGQEAKAEALSIEENLAQTVRELEKNAQDMKNAKVPSGVEDLLGAMSGLLLGGNDQELAGDDAASAEGLLPMMQQMMKNLLSRDVLYPTMTDIRDKYPAWLEEKRGHVADAEYEKREKQYRIVSEVCKEFEAEEDGETQEVKHARFERVLNLMQTMQECGQPPPEIIGCGPEIDFDAFGKPKLPGLDQCSVM
ncbi:peroxisomal biogenesis factor 19-like [Corticium candelabrum]|uniref:peroxisomal biogenesis factor 19-like n=1 Tax=Corticium candelabrum TaxID=121492 RepID=UPI002E257138|nr:peroxisomal biogenesis factor 19-like [Corticium candelabrum]